MADVVAARFGAMNRRHDESDGRTPPQQGEARGRLPIGSIVDRVSPLFLAVLIFFAPAAARADETMTRAEVEQLARHYADLYGVPQRIVLQTVKRESTFRPSARNGPYWGLMQILYPTAKGMGYKGPPQGLLDAETNLNYGVAYLANAYMIAGGNESMTHRLYRSGYYYEAKRKKLLGQLIKATPLGTQPQPVMVAKVEPAPAAPAAPPPLPVAKPVMVAAAAAAPELPIAKPQVAAEPATLPVAKPQVVLASVLPEPSLSLSFGRQSAPASAAALALAEEAAPAAGMPLPPAKPGSAAAESTGPDFTAAYFDIPVQTITLAPLPRPRPGRLSGASASAETKAVVVATASHPKSRPVE